MGPDPSKSSVKPTRINRGPAVKDEAWPKPNQVEMTVVFNSDSSERPFWSFRRSYNFSNKRYPARCYIPQVEAIVFDIDGTIANIEDFISHTCWHKLIDFGITSLSSHYKALVTKEHPNLMEDLRELSKKLDLWDVVIEEVQLKRPDLAPEAIKDLLRETERTLSEARNYLQVIPEALRHLSKRIPVFIATNRDRSDALSFVKEHGLDDVFHDDHVYGRDGDKGIRTKPFPDMIAQIKAEHGFNRLIMVGDSETDLGPLRKNVKRCGVKLFPFAVLRPGDGYDKEYEILLMKEGAHGVFPSADHFVKDLLRAMCISRGDLTLGDYYYIRYLMDQQKAGLTRQIA